MSGNFILIENYEWKHSTAQKDFESSWNDFNLGNYGAIEDDNNKICID